jgi:hypothetical protein
MKLRCLVLPLVVVLYLVGAYLLVAKFRALLP